MSYKVVQIRNHQIVSCRVREYPLCMHYKMDRWVYPRVGLLLVFPKFSDALRFCMQYSSANDVIYRCRTRGLKKVLNLTSVFCKFEGIRKFWESGQYADYSKLKHSVVTVPSGTYGASAVMLTKRLGKASDLIKDAPIGRNAFA